MNPFEYTSASLALANRGKGSSVVRHSHVTVSVNMVYHSVGSQFSGTKSYILPESFSSTHKHYNLPHLVEVRCPSLIMNLTIIYCNER